jgi:hypothetical protein
MVNKYSPEALAEISGRLGWLHIKLFCREIACTHCCDEHDVRTTRERPGRQQAGG